MSKDKDEDVKSVQETIAEAKAKSVAAERTEREKAHIDRLAALYEKLEWMRNKEIDIANDASLLLRTSHDTLLTDDYCDLLFDSDRRKLQINNALQNVAKHMRKEKEWEKVFTSCQE